MLAVLMLTTAFASYTVVSAEEAITPDTSWYNTTDTEFTITTAAQFLGIAIVINSNNEYFRNKTIKIGADIVVNEGNAADWETNPPATSLTVGEAFMGTLDGQGHTISGLYRVASGPTQGLLFKTIEKTVLIKDLAIVNSYFGCRTLGGTFAGRAMYGASVDFKNVYVDVIMRGDAVQVGGFVGGDMSNDTKLAFENCVFAGDIQVKPGQNNYFVGGFVGDASMASTPITRFTNCLNLGTVRSKKVLGGFVGYGKNVTLDRCVNFGIVECEAGGTEVGGLVGRASSVTVTKCYVASDVSALTNCGAIGNDSDPANYDFDAIATTAVKGDAAKTAMPDLDWENTWTTVENGLPMLKCFADLHDALTEPENPIYFGAQARTGEKENTADVRFVGLIGDYTDYEKIGFKFTYNEKEANADCQLVYSGLTAAGYTENPEFYSGKYFYCYSIRGLSAGTYVFGVESVTQRKDEEPKSSAKVTVTVTVDAEGNATIS